MTRSRPLETRFWEKVRTGAHNVCWPRFSGRRDSVFISPGVFENSSRVAWILTYGPIPVGQFVLHRCDDGACCNPACLFLGSHDENMADMVRKGRQQRGERHALAVLTAASVAEARRAYAAGEATQAALAKRYGVGRRHMKEIVNGRAWKHVA